MLKKTKRLTTKEFQEVFQKGKRVSSPLFLVSFIKLDKYKVAVSIPKKKYKNAVDRNYAKRIIFACLKKQATQPSLGIVIVLRKKLDNTTHKEMCSELYDAIKKINI
jgi:ribonuclease P protein component